MWALTGEGRWKRMKGGRVEDATVTSHAALHIAAASQSLHATNLLPGKGVCHRAPYPSGRMQTSHAPRCPPPPPTIHPSPRPSASAGTMTSRSCAECLAGWTAT